MAYRKTEKVLAELEAVRNAIVASAIDIIRKSGLSGLTMDAVKDRAQCSTGTLYNRFGDLDELVAAVTMTMLERDLKAMRAPAPNARQGLASALTVLYARLKAPRLLRALVDQPAYRLGIRLQLEEMIATAGINLDPEGREIAAAGALGAIAGMIDVCDGSTRDAPATLLFVLRGIGLSEVTARKAVTV